MTSPANPLANYAAAGTHPMPASTSVDTQGQTTNPPQPLTLRTEGNRGGVREILLSRNAIAYVRVSTEDQKLGPEAQRAAIESFAHAQGLSIVAWHLDQGISGAAPIDERPALQAALSEARSTRAHLIVAKRDRLARDAMIAAMAERSLAKGCSVYAADGSGNGTSPADALMRTILDGMAEYERALIRSRTKAALKAKRARGEAAGKAPYGFESVDGRLVPSETEQSTIARIKALSAEGLGAKAIVKVLSQEGVFSRAGKPLQRTQVRRILQG